MNCLVGADKISIEQTLELLDTTFQNVAEGVANDAYMFWVGSGISFGRVDGLPQVIARILEFLRSQIDHTNPDCKFKQTLKEALALVAIDLEAEIDLRKPFKSWPNEDRIKKSLVTEYAKLLDIEVDGEKDDYLLWNGVDIESTYADPEIPPGEEHLCLAILIEERSASQIASANWDGLIEKASKELNGGQSSIRVCIRQEDLRQRILTSTLYKFHGCAPSAVENEELYRPYLVGRQSQIYRWAGRPENSILVSTLKDLIATKPTLMLGLSAQDANIQTLFNDASERMDWQWPGERPSYVFSENELGFDQKIMLKNVYKDQYKDEKKAEIRDGSRIKAYASPLLFALVLHVLSAKLSQLAMLITGKFTEKDRHILDAGILELRNAIASHANADRVTAIWKLIEVSGAIIGLFRDGDPGSAPRRYQPLFPVALDQIERSPWLPATGLQEAALAVAVLGHGVKNNLWRIAVCDPDENNSFVLQVTSDTGTANLHLISNNEVSIRLMSSENLEESEHSIEIFSTKIANDTVRSPHANPGRTGKKSTRRVSIESILDDSESFDDLLQQFREQVAL